jgi:hypothetical protein
MRGQLGRKNQPLKMARLKHDRPCCTSQRLYVVERIPSTLRTGSRNRQGERAQNCGPPIPHLCSDRRLLRLAFLSPRVAEAIVEGRQPPDLTVIKLTRRIDLPPLWSAQEQALGIR